MDEPPVSRRRPSPARAKSVPADATTSLELVIPANAGDVGSGDWR